MSGFAYKRRVYTVRPDGNMAGAELQMLGLTLDEGATFDGLTGPQLRALLIEHVNESNIDVPLGELDLGDVRVIFQALSTEMQKAALPSPSAAG